MMKVATVVGARPQFIKAATVSRVMADLPEIDEVLIHTGQHYDAAMSAGFFEELRLPAPRYALGVGSARHGAQTGMILARTENVLLEERPDWVLVYGDTNSTLGGALAAAKLGIRLAHVEAGLRSFNRAMPEEINRVVTDHVSTLLFTPTLAASENLRSEGIDAQRIRQTGDIMLDAARFYGELSESRAGLLDELGVQRGGYVLATVHRAENTDDERRLREIFGGLARVAARWPVVLPLHPRTKAALERSGLIGEMTRSLLVTEPVGYLDMVMLERNARAIATDSGGVQKEAYFHRVPCVTMRDETEWVELVECGVNRLVGADASAVHEAVSDDFVSDRLDWSGDFYGDARAAEKIVSVLLDS